MMMNSSKEKCADWGLLLLRVVLGVIFVHAGYAKLFGTMPGMEGFTTMVAKIGFPAPMFFAYVAALTEFLGGLAMLAGVYTRYAGYGLAFVMLVVITLVNKFAFPAMGYPLALFAMSIAVTCLGAGSMVLVKNVPGDCCGCSCGKKECKMCSGK